MKLFIYYIFIFFVIFSLPVSSQQIAVIKIDFIINNQNDFKKFIDLINNDQLEHRKVLNLTDEEIKKNLKKIEESKLILSENELQNMIIQHENNLIKFNEEIRLFNSHYDNQINNFKNLILDKLLILLQDYAKDNGIDLILNDKSYILASNSIDISNVILNELNKYKFNITLEPYK